MSRRMAFLHLPPIRWLTSFYNPPLKIPTRILKLNIQINAIFPIIVRTVTISLGEKP